MEIQINLAWFDSAQRKMPTEHITPVLKGDTLIFIVFAIFFNFLMLQDFTYQSDCGDLESQMHHYNTAHLGKKDNHTDNHTGCKRTNSQTLSSL